MQIYTYSSLFKVLKLVLKSKKQKKIHFLIRILFLFIIFTPFFRGYSSPQVKIKNKKVLYKFYFPFFKKKE